MFDRLIQSKLYPPRVPERLIDRPHLLDRLNRGRLRPLTLICAPAGYGKSTLAHQWLKVREVPFAWLSLDESDDSLDIVLEYLIAALAMVLPELGKEIRSLLQQPLLPSVKFLAESLLGDLQDLDRPVILAIDDYHLVTDPEIHQFMTRLIHRLPPNLHIVLITRADPPLSLARMRGNRQLREFRAGDLRFSHEETASLLEQIVGRPVADETTALLAERTEGWAAGLQLAARSLRDNRDTQTFLRQYLKSGQRLASDYLLSEVLEQLPDEQQNLLLRTAIVDRFCASLIDALGGTADSNGQEFLAMLWNSNFFLIALDEQDTWYRYHHLFRQLLRQQLAGKLSPKEIAALHLKAGDWFEAQGMVEEAIIHYVRGDGGERAARLVERSAHEVMNQENLRLLERWVQMLPEAQRNRPGILAIRAVVVFMQFRVQAARPLLDEAESGLNSGEFDYTEQEKTSWMGVINAFRAPGHYVDQTPEQGIKLGNAALQQLDANAIYVRSTAELWVIYSMQRTGKTQQAIQMARRLLSTHTGAPDARTNRLMMALGAVYYSEADTVNVRNLAESLREMALRTEHTISLCWANFLSGWSSYQRNLLAEAETYFREVIVSRYGANGRAVVDSATGLVLIQIALGKSAEAKDSLDTLRTFLLDQKGFDMLPIVDSLALRLDQEREPGGIYADLVETYTSQLAPDPWELPVLTWCHAAIRNGGAQHLDNAQQVLASCREFALSMNNKRQLMQIGALQALLHNARGEHALAHDALRTAVLIGEPGGALRLFVDLGPELIPLLQSLLNQGIAAGYIERILNAYSVDTQRGKSDGESALNAEAVALLSELTNREMEVLLQLDQRLTNKEIAAELHISPYTVKKHTLGLYKKLDVNGRRQAVARARELGIIESP